MNQGANNGQRDPGSTLRLIQGHRSAEDCDPLWKRQAPLNGFLDIINKYDDISDLWRRYARGGENSPPSDVAHPDGGSVLVAKLLLTGLASILTIAIGLAYGLGWGSGTAVLAALLITWLHPPAPREPDPDISLAEFDGFSNYVGTIKSDESAVYVLAGGSMAEANARVIEAAGRMAMVRRLVFYRGQ